VIVKYPLTPAYFFSHSDKEYQGKGQKNYFPFKYEKNYKYDGSKQEEYCR
jgi:hypothetical protein